MQWVSCKPLLRGDRTTIVYVSEIKKHGLLNMNLLKAPAKKIRGG